MKESIHQTHRQICFAYQLTGLYMIREFTERYFLADYSYILENHFYFLNAPDYCFKPSLSRIFCVNSSAKVLSPLYEGPWTHLFRISSLCTFIIYKKKEIGFIRDFFGLHPFFIRTSKFCLRPAVLNFFFIFEAEMFLICSYFSN